MGFNLNLSDVELRNFEPVPAGWYRCRVTDWEPVRSQSEKNHNKPGLNVTLSVIEGKYEGSKFFSWVCLWPEAIFTLKGMLDAIGHGDEDFEFESEEDMQRTLGQLLENEEMMVKVAFKKAGTVNGRELDDRNEVKSFKAVGDVDAGADARSALLP